MSAFVVSNQTMQRAVTALHLDVHQSCEDADNLGRELFALNEQAVNHRYRESPHVPVQAGDYDAWSWKVTCPLTQGDGVPMDLRTACDLLKAMECLRYQMTEGEEVPATALYDQLTRRIRLYRSEIVSSLPEYKAAKWDN